MTEILNILNQEPFRFLIGIGLLFFLGLSLAGVLVMGERKVAGYIQLRYGPNRVGPRGLLQPAADVIKLLIKESVSPSRSDRWIFVLAPALMFLPAIAVWLVIPFSENAIVADLNIGILFFIAITSIGALGVIMAGYGSRSNFSLLGALRGAAQMISYEVPLILSLLGVIMLSGSLALSDVVGAQEGGFWNWYVWGQLPMFVIFFISGLAEVKRVPFDLPEGESEIVGGFMIEYSGMRWAMIQAAEYISMAVIAAMLVTLFLGGWQPPLPFLDLGMFNSLWFGLKASLVIFVFLWIRWTVPRLRMDQLMDLGWKVLIPITLLWLFVTAVWMLIF